MKDFPGNLVEVLFRSLNPGSSTGKILADSAL